MTPCPTFRMSRRYQLSALSLMVVGLLALALSFVIDPARAWANLLINNFYFVSLGLSGAVFLALIYVTKGAWASVVKRVPEAMMSCIPVAFLLMIGLCFGLPTLYHWTHADVVLSDPILQHKAPYLNVPFFLIRLLFYFAVWSFFAFLLRRASLQQDRDPSPSHYRRSVRLSGAFIVFFAVTFSFATYDWLMSLEPHWFSTIFSFYQFTSLVLHGVAALTLVVVLLLERGYLKDVVNENHLHDLAKLIFGFSTVWGYIWYSQFLLVWYANIPEETSYFIVRTDPDWIWLFLLNLGINWLIPFLILMSRAAKRSPAVLKRVCILLLVGYWLDLFLQVAPNVIPDRQIGPAEVLIALGFAGLFFWVTGRALTKAPLVAPNDPYLQESLHLHQ